MAVGRKTGGRKKGTPNKATAETREAFKALFEGLVPELVGWIRETATGKEVLKVDKDGVSVTVLDGRDPGKAAELILKLAEFSVPKLARTEVTGESGEAISIEIVRTVAAGTSKD